MNWYIIQTKPNSHLIASKNLKSQALEVFLPLTHKTFKKSGKFVNKTVPLFPSYLFIGTQKDKLSWKSINGTRGVSKAITVGGKYRAIDNYIVDSLKMRCDSSSIILPEPNFSVGEQVKIERGPFTDFIGEVESIDENQRIWVFIELLQQQTRSQLAINDIAKLN